LTRTPSSRCFRMQLSWRQLEDRTCETRWPLHAAGD
jgi:hypothetical protein